MNSIGSFIQSFAQKHQWKLLVVLSLLLLFGFLGGRELNDPDEGRFAEISREMVVSGDWLIPRLCGVVLMQKPPLTYWLMGGAMSLFGQNEWAVRLTSALAGLATLWLTFRLARRFYDRETARVSVILLMTFPLFFVCARLSTTDMLLTLWVTCAVTCWVEQAYTGKKRWWLGSYAAIGFGFLTKGPVVLLFVLAALIPFRVSMGPGERPFKRWGALLGSGLATCIGLSWFLIVVQKNPELLDYFLRYELVERVASNTHSRSQPWWFYIFYLLLGVAPWTPGLLGDPRRLFRKHVKSFGEKEWLLWCWVLLPFVILHLVVSKLATYLLPLLPAVAILLAVHRKRWVLRTWWGALIFSVALAGFGIRLLQPAGAERFPLVQMPERVLVAALALGWMGVTLRVWKESSREKVILWIASMTAVMLLMLAAKGESFRPKGRTGTRDLAAAIQEVRQETGKSELVLLSGRHYSLNFYLGELFIRKDGSVDEALPRSEKVDRYFYTGTWEAFISGAEQFIVVTSNQKEFKILDQHPAWTLSRKINRFGIWIPVKGNTMPDHTQ
jgi:4-amino-4-deoxy-L-arabinose transferase-like glycosyltransferase